MTAARDEDITEGTGGVKSALRVLSIFDYFAGVQKPRTLSDISQDLGYPLSSTLALLRSIHALGYVTYNVDTKCYFPSIRFAMLGHWIPERFFENGGLVQMMERLAAATRETVLLSVQNGLFAQHVHIVRTAQPLSYGPEVGTLRSLPGSAVGRVLLSQLSNELICKLVARYNAQADAENQVKEAKLLKEVAAIRRNGYAYSANVFVSGAAIVAVPLPIKDGDMPMALSLGGPSSRVNTKTIPPLLEEIRSAIAGLSHSSRSVATKHR